jgi:ABC-2 type transport system ATP-binding protein
MTPPESATPAVAVRGLERRFGTRAALAGVTFDVASGERLALLGPNGSGKSTLLRTLATLLRPSGGSAAVCGLDVQREPAAVRHRLGTVFQSPSLDGKLSVRENLRIQGNLYGLTGTELARRSTEALERLALTERARERVETLSGGMKRRVELAKVLLHRPSVLLLDEPSTGLDPAARLEFWSTLLALQQEQAMTLIVATHLLDEADRCTRVALLDEGRLVALDSPDVLKARIGGPVLDVEAGDPDALLPRLAGLGLRARKIGHALRIEGAAGFETAQRIQQAFPREVLAVRLGQPTLEDVFLALTGRRLAAEEAA